MFIGVSALWFAVHSPSLVLRSSFSNGRNVSGEVCSGWMGDIDILYSTLEVNVH